MYFSRLRSSVYHMQKAWTRLCIMYVCKGRWEIYVLTQHSLVLQSELGSALALKEAELLHLGFRALRRFTCTAGGASRLCNQSKGAPNAGILQPPPGIVQPPAGIVQAPPGVFQPPPGIIQLYTPGITLASKPVSRDRLCRLHQQYDKRILSQNPLAKMQNPLDHPRHARTPCP